MRDRAARPDVGHPKPDLLRALIEELGDSHRLFEARVRELEGVLDELRGELDVMARRVQQIAERTHLGEELRLPFDDAWPAAIAAANHGRLGAREREVLRLLTEGHRSPRIAKQLGITLATVEAHRRNIMRKLDLHSVAALTKYAVRRGLTGL
jgi:DNA-binding NarL/FixJ family response regulator